MPKHADAQSAATVLEVSLPEKAVRLKKPIVSGVKVVYLGSNPVRSTALRGSIRVEKFGDQSRRELSEAGITPYVFDAYDALGEPNRARTMPLDHPNPIVRGRVYSTCDHPDHLFAMSQMRDDNKQLEFHITGPPEQVAALAEYFAHKQRTVRRRDQEFEEIATPGRVVG